jgi:hypothetical protein
MIDTAELWKLCFPTGGVYHSNPRVITDGGAVISMIHWKPVTVSGLKGCYIFGVATHPGYRRRGLSSRLMREVLDDLDGFSFAVLIPAEEPLVSYYKRFGFIKRGSMPAIESGKPNLPPACEGDIGRLNAMYTAAYPCRCERAEEDWRVILTEYRVGLGKNGYTVWDERGILEQAPVPSGQTQNPCSAMIKPLREIEFPERPYINLLYN